MPRPATKKILIEQAALKLFEKKGLAGTVIKDIAREANVTEGALYRHYPSKNELAKQLFIREAKSFSAALFDGVIKKYSADKEKLAHGINFLFEYYDKNPIAFSYILLIQHDFPEEKLLEKEQNPYALVVNLIAPMTQASDGKLMAAMVLGLVLQPIVMHRYGHLLEKPIDHVDSVVKAVFRILAH